MQKRGELSRLSVNLLIGCLILILGVVIFILVRGYVNEGRQEVFTDENIDLKISQVKKIDDNTLDITLKRNSGEGEFVGLSFVVNDGRTTEIIKINTSILENQTGNFSLDFIYINASKIKSISVTPIYINQEGSQVIGNVKDEYVTPNTCSNYCPTGAQCGVNDCGMQCGSGCGSGYLCLNYKCIRERTSSGGGSSSDNDEDITPTCTDTCLLLGYTCGTQTICGENVNCGTCGVGYNCNSTGQCATNTCSGSFNQSCTITNGVGMQIRTCTNPPTWDAWSDCNVVSCNLNYVQSGNTCIVSTCSGSSTQSCTIANGVGSQSRNCTNGVWGDWGTCNVVSCNLGYTLCGNNCDISSRSCILANGVGSQSRTCTNGVWSSWGTCTVVSCNSCYIQSSNSCVAMNCNDNNACTTDSCSNNVCTHTPISGCCTSSSHCNDNNACTTDLCSSGICLNIPISNCCTSASQCNDNNACTADLCSISTGICSNLPITPCCGNLIIEGTEQCDRTNLNQQTCATRLGTGYTGTLSCTSSCVFNTNLCVAPCVPTTCAALSRTCGTVSNGCGGTLTCGSYGGGCQIGYSCAVNGTCIKDVVVTCNGVVCGSGYYCLNGACLLDVPGETYFVSTTGNDNNPGTFSQPWRTWGKAFTSPSPGDIVYFRGGVYPMTVTTGYGYNSINDGTAEKAIYYWAYPIDFATGNVPILDCENITPPGSLNHGIYGTADHVHFKGLTVRNVLQTDDQDEAWGWRISGFNTTIELCVAYNIQGVGFRASTNATKMRFINCDTYNNIDSLSARVPGNNGYGFQSQNTQTTTGSVYFYGCRAWNCGDDGFVFFSKSYVEADNCWSFNNGALEGAGNGWKLGFLPDGFPYAPLTRKVTNSIAVYNRASGFTSNDNNNEAVTMQLYNNIAYRNGYYPEWTIDVDGFKLYNTADSDQNELMRTLRNNIAYANEDDSISVPTGALYTHSHNTWDTSGITLSDADFVSVAATFEDLSAPRKADGSLPDLNQFLHLAPGSDLIDKGMIISGYHCATSGSHPGQNCREWYGSAPDLGPFESNY